MLDIKNKLLKFLRKNIQSAFTFLLSVNLLVVATGSAVVSEIATDSALPATDSAQITTDSEQVQDNVLSDQDSLSVLRPIVFDGSYASGVEEKVREYRKRIDDSVTLEEDKLSTDYDPETKMFRGQLRVKFKEWVTDAEKLELARFLGVKYVREDLNLLGAKIMKMSPEQQAYIQWRLTGDWRIESVEPSYGFSSLAGGGFNGASSGGYYGGSGGGTGGSNCSPNDPAYCDSLQWNIQQIHAHSAWNLSPGSKGKSDMSIAVLDSGVNYDHLDLAGRVILGYDQTDPWEVPQDPMDENGHGTFVAGIIGAATNNNIVMSGINWNSKILAIRVFPQTGLNLNPAIIESGINEAVLEHDEDNVKVINLSLGGEFYNDGIEEAINNAFNWGITVVAGARNTTAGNGPNCFIGFPAAYPGVISVVALDQNNNHASGCTRRTDDNGIEWQGIQISAPGKDIHSLTLDSNFSYTSPASATSWATPHVSAVASIIAGCLAVPDPVFVKAHLYNGVTEIGNVGWEPETGYGLVNLYLALSNSQIYQDCH